MSDRLDSDVRRLIEEVELLELPAISEQDPEGARRTYHALLAAMDGDHDGPEQSPVEAIDDRMIAGRAGEIPVRVYEPPTAGRDPVDVVVMIHGGGWMVGDLDTHDHTARAIAARVGARVVSVHYRRAPEHRFPAALHDCLDVIRAVSRDPGTASVSLAGDSAGGNLAAATAIACLESGGPSISAQLLVYPALDVHRSGGSAERYADGYLLTLQDMVDYDAGYLPAADDRRSPLAVPMQATDLAGLPPAIVVTAGHDPLLDEGREYARRLIAADVPTTYLPFPALTHGWMDMTRRIPAAASARSAVLDAFATTIRSARPGRCQTAA